MKILHVNYSSSQGGAAIAARRLHCALCDLGVESQFMCMRGAIADDAKVLQVGGRVKQFINRLVNRVIWQLYQWAPAEGRGPSSLNIFPLGLYKRINVSHADIIHLHWVNGEMMSIKELSKIKKPVVWTLHDMWPFCGAEHCATDNRYVTGYQRSEFRVQSSEFSRDGQSTANRQLPVSNRRPWVDLDRWIFRRKQKHWKNWHPYIVTPSNWLAGCARKSLLFGGRNITVIPNCLDLEVFRPMNKAVCRQQMGLPQDKKLILCGAADFKAHHKGMDLLFQCLEKLSETKDVEVVCFGGELPAGAGLKIHVMGRIDNTETLVRLYNTADVMCVPSRLESFGQTASEPMSCGIPVVAFNTTGLMDIVDHKINGYLAKPFDAKDLAQGIEWVLFREAFDGCQQTVKDPEKNAIVGWFSRNKEDITYDELCLNARAKAERCFSQKVVVEKYLQVYKMVLETTRDG